MKPYLPVVLLLLSACVPIAGCGGHSGGTVSSDEAAIAEYKRVLAEETQFSPEERKKIEEEMMKTGNPGN